MLFDALFGEESRASSIPGVHVSETYWRTGQILPAERTTAGVDVDPRSAMQYTPLWAALRALSETAAMLPLLLYERRPNGDRERALRHPLYFKAHRQPNEEMTSFTWREGQLKQLLLLGNAYSVIERDRAGQIVAFKPRSAERVQQKRSDEGRLFYLVTNRQGKTPTHLWPEEMLHFVGPTLDGIFGINPVDYARETIGLGIAARDFSSSFFGEGATFGGFLKHPEQLSDTARANITKSLREEHTGPDKAHRWKIVEEGMEPMPIGVEPEKAQLQDTRTFEIQEIARWFRIPPHKLQELSHATFTNIEHQALEFLQDSIMPMLARVEQELDRKLLSENERYRYFFEHLVDGLLRGDLQARYTAYSQGRQWGWLSINDVRRLENMNSIGPAGDAYMVPLNMVPADQIGLQPSELPARSSPAGRLDPVRRFREDRSLAQRWRLQRAFEALLASHASRLVTKEVQAISQALDKMPERGGLEAMKAWVKEFFIAHQEFVGRVMGPVFATFIESVADVALAEIGQEPDEAFRAELEKFEAEYTDGFARRHVAIRQGQIEQLLAGADDVAVAQETIGQRLAEWEETSAGKVALAESTRASGAAAKVAWAFFSVRKLVRRASGTACELCLAMDGRTTDIEAPFLKPGDQLNVEDQNTNDMRVDHLIGHPPLHDGCSCGISPG